MKNNFIGLQTLLFRVAINFAILAACATLLHAQAPANPVYVTDRSGNAINVVDPATDKIVGTIGGIPTPQLIAFTPDGKKAYVTTYESNGPVYVIDVKSSSILKTVETGEGNCHGVAVSPNGQLVYVTNTAAPEMAIISTATDTVVGWIQLGTGSDDIVISPDGTKAWVTNQDINAVSVVDLVTGVVTATIPVGFFPIRITALPDFSTVYVANDWGPSISVIDTSSNTVTAEIFVQQGPWGLAVTADGKQLFVGSENTPYLSVIDTSTLAETDIDIQATSRGLSMNTAGIIYLGSTHNFVTVFSTHTGKIVKRITAHDPVDAQVSPLPVLLATKTRLSTSGSPSFVGQPVTFTATVSSSYDTIPDGEVVTFYAGTAVLGSVALVNQTAAYTTSSLPAKGYSIKAVYAGDAILRPSAARIAQTVLKYSTVITLTSDPNPSKYGQPVTLRAIVAQSGPYVPSGQVAFFDGTNDLGRSMLENGVATRGTSTLTVGTHPISAKYLGDSYNARSKSAVVDQVVQ